MYWWRRATELEMDNFWYPGQSTDCTSMTVIQDNGIHFLLDIKNHASFPDPIKVDFVSKIIKCGEFFLNPITSYFGLYVTKCYKFCA